MIRTLSGVLDSATAKKLNRVAKAAEQAVSKRNDAIREAVANGGGFREVAREVGLTHPAVMKIVRKGDADELAG